MPTALNPSMPTARSHPVAPAGPTPADRNRRTTLRPWTAEDREVLTALHAERLSSTEIARRLDRTVEAVSNMSRRLGLRRRDTAMPWTPAELRLLKRMLDEGGSLRQIAEATGHPRSSVADKLRRLSITSLRFRKPWTEPEREIVLRLHAAGASLATIAEAVPSRSIDAIQQKLQELVGPAPFRTAQRQRLSAAVASRAVKLPLTRPQPAIRSSGTLQPSPARAAVRLIRERGQARAALPPAPASTDEMIRWLRSRDFMVLHQPQGWQVDRHLLLDESALLDFVNVRRSRINLPPFTTSRSQFLHSAALGQPASSPVCTSAGA
ncbi:MAG: hypothetical protein WCO00_11240 [Rhodospirillaceae bacterium]